MSADNFDIKVYTPQGLEVEDTANSVTLPGVDGEIGVLPEHIKYATILGTGVLEYYSTSEREAKRLVISEGFCTFGNDELTVLADDVLFPETVDKDAYIREREDALTLIAAGHCDDPERVQAGERLNYIQAVEQLISQ